MEPKRKPHPYKCPKCNSWTKKQSDGGRYCPVCQTQQGK